MLTVSRYARFVDWSIDLSAPPHGTVGVDWSISKLLAALRFFKSQGRVIVGCFRAFRSVVLQCSMYDSYTNAGATVYLIRLLD